MAERLEIIYSCYKVGMQHKEIVSILNLNGFPIGERQLKPIMKSRGLQRRKNTTPISGVIEFITDIQQRSEQLHGYRWMHQRLLDCNINATKELVTSG